LTVRDYYDKVIIKFIKEEITMKRSVFKAERYKFFLAFLLFFAGSLTLLSQSKSFGKVEYAPLPQSQPVDEETKSNILSAFWKAPLHFVANDGQLPDEVAYYAKSEGATVYCTEEGLVFGFAEGSISLKFNAIVDPSMSLRGAKRRSNLEAQKELSGKVNYFIGNDPALWRTNIPTFAEVVYKEVYPGIDLVYSGNQRRLKYTFYLEPGADATQIEMTYDGIESLSVDDDTGELVIQTQWCPKMRDAKPVAYQEIDGVRREVSISFRLIDEKKVGFAVGNYDPKFRLTIDPGYSTYLGGSGSDYGYGIAVDSSGNAYVVGHTTNSTNFPTQSPFQGTYGGGNYDTFVTKLNISGSALEYSTYLGGNSDDGGSSIAVDSSGNAYVVGHTASTNFPTQSPYQGTFGGGSYDAFIASFFSDGSLPVELSLFTVTASEDGVTIRWRTETETNNLGFNIYRSDTKDGNYIKVNASLILGAGTDATPHDYSFIDENVVKGLTYYYYIEDVDFTGKTNISHILEVTVAEIARVREGAKPPKFALFQNFPNPFNPDTWIPYDVASDAVVIIRIYNTNGQLVRQMDLGKQKAGSYVDKKKAAYWDGKDQSGNAVASGVYFYTLKAGDFQATRRMVIVK
jgi:hypothetical protein